MLSIILPIKPRETNIPMLCGINANEAIKMESCLTSCRYKGSKRMGPVVTNPANKLIIIAPE